MSEMNPHFHPELDGEYVVYVDASRRYVTVTDGVCKLLGYSREELLGKTIEDITPPEARSDVADEFRQYLNDSVLSGEYILLAADGRRIRSTTPRLYSKTVAWAHAGNPYPGWKARKTYCRERRAEVGELMALL